jgi:hypothetical protein
MLALSGLAFGVIATPVEASAADIDEDEAAALLCPAGATFYDADSVDDANLAADASVFTYATEGLGGAPDALCTFAIISTDEDATLDGSYSLSVGSAQVAGAVPAAGGATSAVLSAAGQSPSAVFAASGRKKTVDVTKASSAKKKKARKALEASRKKAKKRYVKAGRTSAAKKVMKRKIATATRKYRAAVAPRKTVITVTYGLNLTLPLDSAADQP